MTLSVWFLTMNSMIIDFLVDYALQLYRMSTGLFLRLLPPVCKKKFEFGNLYLKKF